MDEAFLFGPYGEIRDFVGDGSSRGSHRTRLHGGVTGDVTYSGLVTTTGLLTSARIGDAVLTDALDQKFDAFGPPQEVSFDNRPAKSFRSTGWKFFDDLMTDDVEEYYRAVARRLASLEITPLESGVSQVRIEVHDVEALSHLQAAIDFFHAVPQRCDALVDAETRWPDAAQRIAADPKLDLGSLDDIEKLRRIATDATGWLTGVVERRENTIQVSVRLPSGRPVLDGHLALRLKLGSDQEPRIEIDADFALPEVDVRDARLEPEPSGLIGWLLQWGELRLGDADLDEKFRIVANVGVRDLLLRAKVSLLALADYDATIRLSSKRLLISAYAIPFQASEAEHAIEAIGLVWRAFSNQRAGYEDDKA